MLSIVDIFEQKNLHAQFTSIDRSRESYLYFWMLHFVIHKQADSLYHIKSSSSQYLNLSLFMIFSAPLCRRFIGINLSSCLSNITCAFLFSLILPSLAHTSPKEGARVKINNIKVIFKIMPDLEKTLFWSYYLLITASLSNCI